MYDEHLPAGAKRQEKAVTSTKTYLAHISLHVDTRTIHMSGQTVLGGRGLFPVLLAAKPRDRITRARPKHLTDVHVYCIASGLRTGKHDTCPNKLFYADASVSRTAYGRTAGKYYTCPTKPF